MLKGRRATCKSVSAEAMKRNTRRAGTAAVLERHRAPRESISTEEAVAHQARGPGTATVLKGRQVTRKWVAAMVTVPSYIAVTEAAAAPRYIAVA
jgi:hypothetical protein